MDSNNKIAIGLIAPFLLLAGCGGGDSGNGNDSPDNVPETSTENLLDAVNPGVFQMSREGIDDPKIQFNAMSLLSPTGQVIAVFDRKDIRTYELQFEQDGTFSGSETHIYFFDEFDEWSQVSFTIEGEALDKSLIVAQGETPDGRPQDPVRLERDDALSNQGASISDVNRTFLEQASDEIATSITIDEDGTLSGSDSTGCTFKGNMSVPDERFNVYEVSFNATGCGDTPNDAADLRNGSYTGLATYNEGTEEIEFVVENGEIPRVFFGS